MEKNVSLENVAACFAAHRPRPILRLRHFAILALLTEIDGELHFILNKRAKGIHQPAMSAFPAGTERKTKHWRKPPCGKQRKKSGFRAGRSSCLAKAIIC